MSEPVIYVPLDAEELHYLSKLCEGEPEFVDRLTDAYHVLVVGDESAELKLAVSLRSAADVLMRKYGYY